MCNHKNHLNEVILLITQNMHFEDEMTNLSNLYPPAKGYFRETCKSQKNPIYLDHKKKPVKYVLVHSLITKSTYLHNLTFQANPRGQWYV